MPRLSLFWQIFLAFGTLIVLAVGGLGFVGGAWGEQQALAQIEELLKARALMLREMLPGGNADHLRQSVETLHQQTETRITLIAPNGRVVVESDRDPSDLDDHGQRPEVETARTAPFGIAKRYSKTLQKEMMYVAVAMPSASTSIGFVRVALPTNAAQAHGRLLRNFIWGGAVVTILLALLPTWWLTRRLVLPLRELTVGAQRNAAGEFGQKVYLDRSDELAQLADAFSYMTSQLANQFTHLDEDRQQLRAVLGSMVEGVIAIDTDQTILFANNCAGQMLEFATKSAAGRKLWEVVRQRAVQDLVRNALRAPTGEPSKLEFSDPAGKSLLLHVAQLPGETARGAVLVFHDTTELRRLERLRQDFVANVSHELKTPLSVITACVETLLDGGIHDVENQNRFLTRIHEESHRLHALILDLLSLARIESGEQLWTLSTISVADLVQACVDRHQARARGKKQTVTLHSLSADQVQIFADEEALAEILNNLVDNALKYTPEGGAIRLSWWNDETHVTIEVNDTGIGIPEADLPRIFERFYRVDKARSRELGGTGLGLAIVKHLVQALHGTIRAASVVGEGSTFTIRLPIAGPDGAGVGP